MLNHYFKDSLTLTKYQCGPAGSYLDGFIDWFELRGYQPGYIRRHMCGADRFCRWAAHGELSARPLDRNALDAFAKHLQEHHLLKYPSGGLSGDFIAARHFVAFLQAIGETAPSTPPPSAEPELLMAFRSWMQTQRGTLETTLNGYQFVIVDLLQSLGEQPQQYSAEALRTFVFERTRGYGTSKARNVVTAVRMFVRFLIAMGRCTVGLDHAIPTLAHWRLATLPKYLSGEAIEQIIASCDLSMPIGVRDRAVLLLLARLGLRASDVASLTLTAIDWSSATIQVSGKNRRATQLPLSQEVGDAMLAYLEQRPAVNEAHVFITDRAPLRRLSRSTIGKIVGRAIHRAGVNAPSHGSHVLRHSLATALLREGMSLPTIGTVLRHASIETTAIYAKVDVPALRQVARTWPEVSSC